MRNQGRTRGGVWSTAGWLGPPVVLLLVVPGRLFCFGSFGDFGCGVPLFVVVLVIYIYMYVKVGGDRCLVLDWPVATYVGDSCSPGCLW